MVYGDGETRTLCGNCARLRRGYGLECVGLKMPVWAFHGACDNVVSPTQSDEMVAALQAAGADVKYTRVENVGHDVWNNAYNEELIAWLLSY